MNILQERLKEQKHMREKNAEKRSPPIYDCDVHTDVEFLHQCELIAALQLDCIRNNYA